MAEKSSEDRKMEELKVSKYILESDIFFKTFINFTNNIYSFCYFNTYVHCFQGNFDQQQAMIEQMRSQLKQKEARKDHSKEMEVIDLNENLCSYLLELLP